MILNLSPKQAALIMGKTEQFVRIGLQRKLLPFGSAIILKQNGRRYTYHIPAAAFAAYMGMTMEQLSGLVQSL